MRANQYYQDDFFSYESVKEIIKEFEWPEPYELIDEDFSVEIKFSKCIIELSSDGQGGVSTEFIRYKNQKLDIILPIALEVTGFNPDNLDLEDIQDVWPNLEDTKRVIRNRIKILHGFFLPFIKGEDENWIDAAKKWDIS